MAALTLTVTTGPALIVAPPGKGRISSCPECKGVPGLNCTECHGTGKLVWHACPLCGDSAWDYVNGSNDRDGMACRIGCGYTWTATDPGWLAQRLPD